MRRVKERKEFGFIKKFQGVWYINDGLQEVGRRITVQKILFEYNIIIDLNFD